jgi:Cu2+-exporting ATPase
MKEADLSVSMAGASSLAQDVAEVLFLDESLGRFEDLLQISASLRRIAATLGMTLAPGVLNLAGALVFRYSILTSLLVNATFGALAAHGALRTVDGAPGAAGTEAGEVASGALPTGTPRMLPAASAS